MANKRWVGNALDVSQVTSITVQNTWATGDTATLTINGKDLKVTVGTDAATTDVAAALAAAFNTTIAATGLLNDESRNVGGQEIPEFTEITAAADGSDVVLTANAPGKPFAVSVSETTAGDGTLASPSDVVACTGRNFFDNPDNWDAGSVPVDNDVIYFDSGDVSVLYGLDQTGVTPAGMVITMNYSGHIGLPEYHAEGAAFYREYRDQFLKLGAAGDSINTQLTIGLADGSGSGRIKVDFLDSQYTANIVGSGQQAEQGVPAILLMGTHAANLLNVLKGTVGVAFNTGGAAATLATLRVGYQTNAAGDAMVLLGSGVSITNIDQSGGTLVHESGSTTNDMTDGLQVIRGSSAHAAISVDGGELRYMSTGTLTTLKIGGGGTADFGRDMQSRTVTNCELHNRGTLLDPFKTVTFTNGIDLVRASLEDVTLNLGEHVTLTPSAV